MDERELSTVGEEEERIGRLLREAGPRSPVPPGDLEAITAAARQAWRQKVGPARVEGRRPAVWLMAALAASLAVAVGLAWWSFRGPDGGAMTVARVESAAGGLLATAGGADPRPLAVGDPVPRGARLRTAGDGGDGGSGGHASLRLSGGTVLRLAAGTDLRLPAAGTLDLSRGAVYLDTGAGEAGAVAVRTRLGTATDVGTRFSVELVAGTDGGLRVRVRDGLVAVEGGGRHVVAPAGQEFVLRRDGSLVRRSLAPWGTEWRWVLEAAPPFAVEGSTVAELLAWVGRETGWRVRFEDPALAAEAGGIVLHGSLGDLAPDQVPFAVLPGAGLDAVLADGTLRVRRAAGGGG